MHILFRSAGFETHERVRKIVIDLVVLRRKVVSLGLALLPDLRRELIALMQVMRNRAHVVEKLAEEIPSAFALHHVRPQQKVSGGLNRVLQQKLFTAARAIRRPILLRWSR